MIRTERHIIVKSHANYKDVDNLCFLSKNLCFLSKNLYNYANYLIRQEFIKNGKWLRYEELDRILKESNQIDYRSLSIQTSQCVLDLLDKNWKSFFKAVKEYKKNLSKFLGRPKIPKYKDKIKGRNIVVFTYVQVRLENGYIYFPKKSNLEPLKTKINNLQQVRIIPQSSCYVIEVVYRKEKKEHDLDSNLYLGIDLGIDNLATLTTNLEDKNPLLVNGKVIKSINQFYNKYKAKLMSYVGDRGISNRIRRLTFRRNNMINNYLHHTSRFIINYCIENKIKNIVIGYNKEWKQEINIGRVNNQKFVNIPYLTLINQIKYKAEEVGIDVILNEESYTSKCDSLALEKIKKHETYLGRRIKRGLFQSNVGKLINADVNGSLNILRKVIGDDFINLINKSCVLQPVRMNILTKGV